MAEVLQLLPEADDERDLKIFKQWKSGKRTVAQLARDHVVPVTQIIAILERYLPSLLPKAQVLELQKILYDTEELRVAFQEVALDRKDPDCANVALRAAHEIAQLRMFVGGSAHATPMELQRTADPKTGSSAAVVRQVLHELCADGSVKLETQASIRQLDQRKPEDEN